MFVEGNQERIFLNTALGCESKCKFCYLPSQNYNIGNKPKFHITSDEIVKKLLINSSFIKGKFGTVLSIGCYSECWSKNNKKTTIELIKSLVNLGNPIQLATKRIISREEFYDLNSAVLWKGQLTIFISSTTVSEYKVWEKSTSDPYKRFNIFSENLKAKIPICLYLKPILPNITIKDINIYAKYVTSYNLQTIVGSMFIYDEKSISEQKAPIPSNKLFTVQSNDENTIFNKLFSLNLGTYQNSIQAIEFWRNIQMANNLVSSIKSDLYSLESNETLEDYLLQSICPQNVILDLLNIYGYVDIECIDHINSFVYNFNIGDTKSELITLQVNPNILLTGIAIKNVQQTYKLVKLIETKLQDVLYYPQDLRSKIINDYLDQLEINEDVYKRILNNWFS